MRQAERSGAKRVVYYRVEDPNYPRNREIRRRLAIDGGFDVRVVRRARTGNKIVRLARDLRHLWLASRGASAIVLAEMNWSHAPLVWIVARLRRTSVVIDQFVGLYETAVEDWASARPGSFRARLYRAQDLLATRSADLLLIDTHFRARQLSEEYRPSAAVVSVPVGAPAWAVPTPRPRRNTALKVLYYGNYIPLHGIELVLDAIASLPSTVEIELILIGGGSRRRVVEERALELGLGDSCHFLDAVAESELAVHIARSDVVLGVFGPSRKARSVIANKVWQGLACGRTVLTQESESLGEIAALVPGLLRTTAPGSVAGIAEELRALSEEALVEDLEVDHKLNAYVASQFTGVIAAVEAVVRKGNG